MACTKGPKNPKPPKELRWPYRWLEQKCGDRVSMWFSPEQIKTWKENGLGDFEADEVCIRMAIFPHEVFPGYLDAGLDSGIYP